MRAMHRMPRPLVIGLAVVVTSTAARAHDTWLLPSSSAVPITTRVEVALTSGLGFPKDETAIDPARVAVASARLAGATTKLEPATKGEDASSFVVRPQAIGIATVWVELHPRTLELTAEQVEEYLSEIGAPAAVRERYEKQPPPRRWRESYVKHAKTFVRSGEPTSDTS